MNAHSVANASLVWKTARHEKSGWVSASCAFPQKPLDLLPQAHALGRPYVFWQSADRRMSLLGVGELTRLRAAGPQRLQAIAEAAQSLSAPVLLGAFSFSGRGPLAPPFQPFAPADFMVPQLLFEERDGGVFLRLLGRESAQGPAATDVLAALLAAVPADAQLGRPRFADPPGSRAVWSDEVQRATAAIRGGSLEKVVLARRSLALSTAPIDVPRVVTALSRREKDCKIFAVHRAGRTFLGATPEGLVRVSRGVAEVPCVAGSAPRGQTPDEDRRIGEGLLMSAKNRSEHAFVVRAVESTLRERGLEPAVESSAPGLLKLQSVQHLFTPVRARLAEDASIFALAAALHPTPAMGGTPQAQAKAWISDHEPTPRGLFSGGIGYWREDGEGELDVAIRCGLVRGRTATLWAGCGIVEDSDPDEELRETVLKFRPMWAALSEANEA